MYLPRSLSNFQSMGFPLFVPERRPPQSFIRPSFFTVTWPRPGLVIGASIDVELQDGSPFAAFDEFRRIDSPFVAKFIEAFTTHEMGQADLVVVYANHPGAIKLESALDFVKSERLYRQAQLWIQQLLYLQYSVHKAGLTLGKIFSINNIIVPVSFEK